MKKVHLCCPHCSKPHIDEDAWATFPHRTHRCVDDTAGKGCQHEWEAEEKCVSIWDPRALLARAQDLAKSRWPGRWEVGATAKTTIWAPHREGIGGTAGRRLIARINEPFGRMEDAEFIATMPQLLDALIAALEAEIGRSGYLQELAEELTAQDKQWGGPSHDDEHTSHDWIAIFAKHLGKAVNWPFRLDVFRRQMVRIGGLALAGLRWADRFRARLEKKGGAR